MKPLRKLLLLPVLWAGIFSAPAQSAVEQGSRAVFVGFLGAEEQQALIYLTPSRSAAGPAILYAIPMAGGDTTPQWPIFLNAAVLQDHPSPKTFHEYYLFRLAKVQRDQLGELFTEPAAQITPLPGTMPDMGQALFQVAPDQTLAVRPTVLRELSGMRIFDAKRGLACAEWEGTTLRMACETCFLQEQTAGFGPRKIPVCRAGRGVITRNVPGPAGRVWQRGTSCDCHAPSYEVAATVALAGTERLGISTLAAGIDVDPAAFQSPMAAWGPPTIWFDGLQPKGLAAYRNRAGSVLVVGSFVHTGPARITHFPVVAVMPPVAASLAATEPEKVATPSHDMSP